MAYILHNNNLSESALQIDGVSVYWGVNSATVSDVTSTEFTVDFDIDTWLTNTGYTNSSTEKYYMVVQLSGTNFTTQSKEITIKPAGTKWPAGTYTSSNKFNKTASLTFTKSTTSALSLTLKCTMMTNKDTSDTKNTNSLSSFSIPASTITPTNPTSVTATSKDSNSTSKFYIGDTPDSTITISCSGGTNIKYYRYYVSINGGTYTSLTTTSTSSTYSYTPTTLDNGTTYQFRIDVKSSTDTVSSGYVYSNTVTVGYRPSTAPTNVLPYTIPNDSFDTFLLGYGGDTSMWVFVYGGTNVDTYTYQVKINGGDWADLKTTANSNMTYSAPASAEDGTTYQFRVRINGLDGGTTDYYTSSDITTVKINGPIWVKNSSGTWVKGIPYVKVDDSWVVGEAYININGSWVKTSR